jgi:beta-phosphoglucomutase
VFDFNGVVSLDEPVLYEVLAELARERGVRLTEERYFTEFVGHSDEAVLETLFAPDRPTLERLIAERVARYRRRVVDGSTVPQAVREAVQVAAARVPCALVSGSYRPDVEPVLAAAGLEGLFTAVVTAEDVERMKPDPEGYVLALERLDRGLVPADAVALEDTGPGIAAAKAAGLHCVGVASTLPAERLAPADLVVPALDRALIERLIGGTAR